MSNTEKFVLKGDIAYSKDRDNITVHTNAYLVCEGKKSAGVFDILPEQYRSYKLFDYTDKLIIPGLVDLHIHAPQCSFKGVGLDLELLEWLSEFVFPKEGRYKDVSYAMTQYDAFCNEMRRGATTHAVIFTTVHRASTEYLMKTIDRTGLQTMVGKVNMDVNAPDSIRETTESSIHDTREWLKATVDKFENVKPILTPRFVPSCSAELLSALGEMSKEYGVAVQSHLSENRSEVELVMNSYPDRKNYADVYAKFGLLKDSVMAHCVQSSDEELQMIKDNHVTVAHCAQSNINLCSGVARVRKMLDMGLEVGLGTDVAGGCNMSVMRAAVDSILASKLLYTLAGREYEPLSFENVFYLATIGGGRYFGEVGSFKSGCDMNAVVIDDSALSIFGKFDLRYRLERAFYIYDKIRINAKFVNGSKVL